MSSMNLHEKSGTFYMPIKPPTLISSLILASQQMKSNTRVPIFTETRDQWPPAASKRSRQAPACYPGAAAGERRFHVTCRNLSSREGRLYLQNDLKRLKVTVTLPRHRWSVCTVIFCFEMKVSFVELQRKYLSEASVAMIPNDRSPVVPTAKH